MSDMDDEIRESLQRRADDVRPHREVPPELGRRAGRRIAFNSVAAAALAVVVLAGAFVGFRAVVSSGDDGNLGGSPGPTATAVPTSGSTPPTSSGSSSPGTGGVPTCTSGDLRANAQMLGAAGSREGVVDLTNFSDTDCTLQGEAHVALLTSPGHPITSGVTFLPAPAGWKVEGDPKPAGWPDVTLHPGDTASVRIRWGNWCPQGRAVPLWQVQIPGGGAVDVTNGMEEAPPCNGPTMPSTVEVGPFEPQRDP